MSDTLATTAQAATVQAKAGRIASVVKTATGYGFDPSTLIQLLTTLLPMLLACFGLKSAAAAARNPSRLVLAAARLQVRRAFPDAPYDAREVLVSALLTEAARTSEAEFKTMAPESA